MDRLERRKRKIHTVYVEEENEGSPPSYSVYVEEENEGSPPSYSVYVEEENEGSRPSYSGHCITGKYLLHRYVNLQTNCFS